MASKRLIPNAENCTLEELKSATAASPRKRGYIRLNAILHLLEGYPSMTVAHFSNVTTRTLYRWVKRFNEQGIDGLVDRPRKGAPRKITAAQSEHYKDLIKHPAKVGETHWTGVKFHGYLTKTLLQEVGYRTVIRWLHENDFRLKVPQPWPDRQDEAKRPEFLEKLQKWLSDQQSELWYLDEFGVEGDPRPKRRWAVKGEKTRLPYSGDHIRMNVAGIICPQTGEFYALEFTHMDAEVFQVFLDHANKDITTVRSKNYLICDNASWHKKKSLQWGNFTPIFLPPYSPDFNPIEKLWLIIKAEWFTDFYAKTQEQLVERLDKAL
jgi:transposase